MCNLNTDRITYDSVKNLRCDREIYPPDYRIDKDSVDNWSGARFMFVFEGSDLHSAALCLAQKMQEPFDSCPIASIGVEESIYEEFIDRVRSLFRQVRPAIANHPRFTRNTNIIFNTNIQYFVAKEEDAPRIASPMLVVNINQNYFGNGASGVTTVHPFKELREGIKAALDETPAFEAIYVFQESAKSVYILADRLNSAVYFVNCTDVSLRPIWTHFSNRNAHVVLQNGYHYESIIIGGRWRIIVMPHISHLPHLCTCPPKMCICGDVGTSCVD